MQKQQIVSIYKKTVIIQLVPNDAANELPEVITQGATVNTGTDILLFY